MSTLACVALAALAESAPSLTGPIVKLPNGDGSVRGDRLADLNVNRYLGIPFAAPPVGNGRWASPEPPKPWAPTVRPALHWAPNCAQLSPPAWQTMYHNKSAYSEDCLYLNVFAPEPMPGEQETLDYPVMVWIHGGGYAYGGAHDSELDGTQLADMANVVVVTIQYRLDVFGFLGAESLRSRSSDNSTGNWAMQDQRMALRWVKENIGAFRGNASQITLRRISGSWRRLKPRGNAQILGPVRHSHHAEWRLPALGGQATGLGSKEFRRPAQVHCVQRCRMPSGEEHSRASRTRGRSTPTLDRLLGRLPVEPRD